MTLEYLKIHFETFRFLPIRISVKILRQSGTLFIHAVNHKGMTGHDIVWIWHCHQFITVLNGFKLVMAQVQGSPLHADAG